LASISERADSLAINNVTNPSHRITDIINTLFCIKRINNQIPAVTKVELWTRDLTGVGAAIAAGSQLTNGH
jgi:hypothetical protein